MTRYCPVCSCPVGFDGRCPREDKHERYDTVPATKREMSWASTCPVTRSSHNWMKIKPIGKAAFATCQDCEAEWIGVEGEWKLWDEEGESDKGR